MGGNGQGQVHQRRQFTAAASQEADHKDLLLTGGFHRGDHVGGIAAGADGDQHVARMAQRFDLPGKHLGKAVIVASGGQHRGIDR